jgi:hypothetical protein
VGDATVEQADDADEHTDDDAALNPANSLENKSATGVVP